MSNDSIVLVEGPFKVSVTLSPFSFSIFRDTKKVSFLYSKDNLKLRNVSTNNNEASFQFLDPSGNTIFLSLILRSEILDVKWSSPLKLNFLDRYYLSGHLYGFGFLSPQNFPINEDIEIDQFPTGNVQVPYCFTSSGIGILYFNYRPVRIRFTSKENLFEFGSEGNLFEYKIILGSNATDVYYKFIRIVGKPATSPSHIVFSSPIYSTWAQYKTAVDQEKVLQYARDIIRNKFPIGIIEIDDKWEVHYGDFEFDKSKFPNPSKMVQELHDLGFLVTLWVYPFVNLDSSNYNLLTKEGYLVKDKSENVATVRWWNGEAGLIDLTNPKAYEWFKEKLKSLQETYGFDGFKFDAGDAIFFPLNSVTYKQIFPAQYGDLYMKFVSDNFHDLSETRVSTFSQSLGLLTRLGDKDSRWGLNNGLHSVITSTLTYSLIGYPFVLPDMIGGNEYHSEKCDAELFIRWVEVSVPMPSIQFSILPWRPEFDERVISISREYAWLHVKLSKYILSLVGQSLKDGSPIIRPLFFNYEDENLYSVNDEFMLGESLLFAPVVKQGKNYRDVILPKGKWLDLWENKEYVGPTTIYNYDAPIYKLPIFMNVEKPLDEETVMEVRKILSILQKK